MSGHGTGDAPGGKPPAAAKSRAKSAARPAAAPVARIAAADVEAMALALPGAASGGHFSARDVRVSGRIFASLPADGGVVVRLTADQQAAWSTDAPGALAPIASRFAPHGWTRADPARLNREQAARLVRNAWENVAPQPPRGPQPPRRAARRRSGA
ncbi:YjbR protein [Albimonas donghaensis]|uniref:YjbR protein n=1 Tax=Albimonas donghaensis TaxID=356660 RepID=A0A1H3AIY5_9RHOB|nr:MmcQ/YjbR family DNA-binding protein [Albimonas donghaensis]SDX29583.1 YjbR protein [Albimonas donghaensis]